MKIYSFDEVQPKRGEIICFNDYMPAYYKIDYSGSVWGFIGDEAAYCCQLEDLLRYGNYTHWARLSKFPFKVPFYIPDE